MADRHPTTSCAKLDITDDAMAPDYLPGHAALCDPLAMFTNGDACCVELPEGRILRRVYDLGDGRLKLTADNPKYETIIVTRASARSIAPAVWKMAPAC